MQLMPGWDERLKEVAAARGVPSHPLPRDPHHYAARTTFVAAADEAAAMIDLALGRPIAWVGLDADFRYDRPGVDLGRGRQARDPRGVRPLLLSAALAEPDGRGGVAVYPFAVDLRREEVLPAVRDLLALPCPFVAHSARAELICLMRLGLPLPEAAWDTLIAERALRLGRGHARYRVRPGVEDGARIRSVEDARVESAERLTLAATCRRYGVEHPAECGTERLWRSSLGHPEDAPFRPEQVAYAAAHAIAAARLYPAQVQAAAAGGILQHLVSVEMPWVVTAARMHWRGVRVDAPAADRVRRACLSHLPALRERLRAEGIANVNSPRQLEAFFARHGLLDLFRRGGGYAFDRGRLEEFQHRHPAIPTIRAARRILDLLRERILDGALVGADGRVHPEYVQLGTETGRETCRWPNIMGLGRAFRPLIVPGEGRGLGEADLCQIEVGIAAAVYRDPALVEKFNAGDVYSAMARDFYRAEIGGASLALADPEFKRACRRERDVMKACTLGILYGLTPRGLAARLGIAEAAAAALQGRFLGMFPALRRALEDGPRRGELRGYAATATGLRRHREGGGPLSGWERNWMRNHPVQGSAAAVFKAAGNRLDRLYRRYDAWLVIPMHDAFVFEAPLEALREVAGLTSRAMCEAVQEAFPDLHPRVEVNIEHPGCWNKDGHADSLERWIEDPLHRF